MLIWRTCWNLGILYIIAWHYHGIPRYLGGIMWWYIPSLLNTCRPDILSPPCLFCAGVVFCIILPTGFLSGKSMLSKQGGYICTCKKEIDYFYQRLTKHVFICLYLYVSAWLYDSDVAWHVKKIVTIHTPVLLKDVCNEPTMTCRYTSPSFRNMSQTYTFWAWFTTSLCIKIDNL